VIARFSHKGLKRLFEDGDRSKVRADQADKLSRVLDRLDVATQPDHMDLPGWKLHPLTGNYAGFWAVWINKNWRVIWRFEGADATDVDLKDYH